MAETTDTPHEDTERATQNVRSAVALLSDFEDCSVEVQHGAIKHAISELENARRALPEDY